MVPTWYPRDELALRTNEKSPARAVIAGGGTPEMPPMSASNPTASIIVREQRCQPFYEAKLRYGGRQIKRRIGPAWLERDPAGDGWRRHRGRVAESAYDERTAHVAAAQLVAET